MESVTDILGILIWGRHVEQIGGGATQGREKEVTVLV